MKTKKKQKIYAFIDSQNLNLAIRDQGWILDFRKFRRYLLEKYHVSKAFIFIGYIEENNNLYEFLQHSDFILIFKPVIKDQKGEIKGNVDADLVLHTMIEYNNYDKATIVSGDGDFYSLVRYLLSKNKLLKLFVPNKFTYSTLLRQVIPSAGFTVLMNDLRMKLAYKKNGGST